MRFIRVTAASFHAIFTRKSSDVAYNPIFVSFSSRQHLIEENQFFNTFTMIRFGMQVNKAPIKIVESHTRHMRRIGGD